MEREIYLNMERELIIWRLFGKRLVSYKENENGDVVGTGFFNPIVDRFRLIIMLIFQTKYFNNYNLGKYSSKLTLTYFPNEPLGLLFSYYWKLINP